MKAARFLAATGIVISFSAAAEPYAEWGVFADGTLLSEFDTSMRVPDAASVPIPLAPGGVFITNGGDRYCSIEIRTERSVEEVCDFYESKLSSPEYEHVEPPVIGGAPSCAIYEGGNMESNGVWIYQNSDPLVAKNGVTLIDVGYIPPIGKTCNE